MPTYRYRCEGCGDEFELWQSITDDALTSHDGDGGCGGHLVKVLTPAGIVLKGSGFYKTDSRGGRQKSSSNGDGAKEKSSETSSDSSSSGSDSKSSGSDSKSSGSDSKSSGSDAKSTKKAEPAK